jgi:hypothetical protein
MLLPLLSSSVVLHMRCKAYHCCCCCCDCGAAGALHHLSFLDDAKQQLGQSSQLRLLVELLLRGKADSQTYDNLVGCLWNVGLLAGNGPRLAAAGAPAHLVRPVPDR